MRSGRAAFLDLVVAVLLVLLLGTYSIAQFNRARETANRVKCASNLRTIGQAMLLYSNDNRGAYPRAIYDMANPTPVWSTPYEGNPKLGAEPRKIVDQMFHPDKCDVAPKPNDVTAALYLLMRHEDITSGVFVCPSSGLKKLDFGGATHNAKDWSNWPGKAALAEHLSYSYQNPYASKDAIAKGFKFNNAINQQFVIAGDMNPGIDALTKVNVNSAPEEIRKVNSVNHGPDGQNFLFGDGHVEFDQSPFVGVNGDNVYTFGASGVDAKDKGGDGIVGSPVGPADSVLLPTAKDLGVVDGDGALTAAAKKSREAALEADRPVTPAEQEATRQKVIGNFVRGNSTMKISEGKIEIAGDKVATFNFKFAGLDRTKAMLNLMAADDPASISSTITIDLTPGGMMISGPAELNGQWTRR